MQRLEDMVDLLRLYSNIIKKASTVLEVREETRKNTAKKCSHFLHLLIFLASQRHDWISTFGYSITSIKTIFIAKYFLRAVNLIQ